MSLQMPHGVQKAFEWLGLEWPQADEDKLFAAGDEWTSYAGKLRTVHDDAYRPASTVWTSSTGEATDAFHAWWTANPDRHLPDDADGADLVGAALHVFGAVTIALKMSYIAQLIALAAEIAQAIATAFITFGASLAEIPAFAAAARLIVKQAIEKAVKEGVQATVKALFERAEKSFVEVAVKDVAKNLRAKGMPHPSGLTASRRHELDQIIGFRVPTKNGMGLYPMSDQQMRNAARQVTHDPHQFTIDMHGSEYLGHWDGKDITPQDMKYLLDHPKSGYNGGPIRLVMCTTGKESDGFASQLSHLMGANVKAPTTPISNTAAGDLDIDPPGQWNYFFPKKGTTP